MDKRSRRALARIWVFAPLGFMALGLAAAAVSSLNDGQWLAGVIGAGAALALAFYLGRKSVRDGTAVAVAAAVADARAEAIADARAQAVAQVAVINGQDRGELEDVRNEFSWLTQGPRLGIDPIPESAGSIEELSRVESRRDAERVARSALDSSQSETRVEESERSDPSHALPNLSRH